jgi:hypothetical protein
VLLWAALCLKVHRKTMQSTGAKQQLLQQLQQLTDHKKRWTGAGARAVASQAGH